MLALRGVARTYSAMFSTSVDTTRPLLCTAVYACFASSLSATAAAARPTPPATTSTLLLRRFVGTGFAGAVVAKPRCGCEPCLRRQARQVQGAVCRNNDEENLKEDITRATAPQRASKRHYNAARGILGQLPPSPFTPGGRKTLARFSTLFPSLPLGGADSRGPPPHHRPLRAVTELSYTQALRLDFVLPHPKHSHISVSARLPANGRMPPYMSMLSLNRRMPLPWRKPSTPLGTSSWLGRATPRPC